MASADIKWLFHSGEQVMACRLLVICIYFQQPFVVIACTYPSYVPALLQPENLWGGIHFVDLISAFVFKKTTFVTSCQLSSVSCTPSLF